MASEAADSPAVSERAALRKEIDKLIKPWTKSNDDRLTVENLILLSVARADQPISRYTILDWITCTFKFYRDVVEYRFLDSDSRNEALDATKLRSQLQASMELFDLPLTKLEGGGTSWPRYSMSTETARSTLRCVLDPEQEVKPFRFFDLPPELRNTVYQMVFGYPGEGLAWQGRRSTPGGGFTNSFEIIFPIPPADDSESSSSDGSDYEDDSASPPTAQVQSAARTWSLGRLLAPLTTSRQFYEEAMPTFYGVNKFCFHSFHIFETAFRVLDARRRDCIRSLALTYARYDTTNSAPALRGLAALPGLRKLELDVSEQWWTERGYQGAQKYTSVLKMSGVAALKKIQGLEAVVFRNCPTLQQTYEVGMLQQVKKKVKRVSGRTGKDDENDNGFVLNGKKEEGWGRV